MIELTREKIERAHQVATEDAQAAAYQFAQDNPACSGTCGSAVALICFGKRRKAIDLFKTANIITESDAWQTARGRGKSFTVQVDYRLKNYSQQNIDYPETALRAYTATLKALLDVDAYVHSWVD